MDESGGPAQRRGLWCSEPEGGGRRWSGSGLGCSGSFTSLVAAVRSQGLAVAYLVAGLGRLSYLACSCGVTREHV